MTIRKNRYCYFPKNILSFLIVFFLFQSCKVYQKPTTLREASTNTDKGYMKITMINGDEFIYENIEVVDGNFYGTNTKEGKIITTLLKKDEVKDVQRQNKKSSVFFKILGATVGIGSIFLAITMFGS